MRRTSPAPIIFAALVMHYNLLYILLLLTLCRYWIVNAIEPSSNTPTSSETKNEKEKLKYIPEIPELSSSIKDPAIWKNGTRMIFFYTPWCTHSQFMKPLLYDVIEQLYYHNLSDIWVGQIDVSIHSDIVRTFRIKTTPTLLFLLNGTRYEFNGEVTVQNIFNFVATIMSPSFSEVNSSSDIESLQRDHDVLFLLVHDEELDADWQRIFTLVSKERVLIGCFIYTTNINLPNEMGFSLISLPGIVVLKDGKAFHYTGGLSKYKLTLWVENEQFPSLPVVNGTSFRTLLALGHTKRIVILLLTSVNQIPLNEKRALEAVRRVAESRKLHSGYQFTVLVDQEFSEKITGSALSPPTLYVWERNTGFYYLFEPEDKGFSEKTISSFIYSISSGKGQPLGGPTYTGTLKHYCFVIYSLVQAMISHRPILSVVAVVSILAGLFVCITSRRKYTKNTIIYQKEKRKRSRRIEEAKRRQGEEELRRRQTLQESHEEEEEEEEEEETDKNK